MSSEWSRKDYESASAWISENEDGAQASAFLETPNGLAIALPKGLPALGARFHGYLMLAPIPVIIAILLLIPIFMIFGDWPINAATLSITAGCLVMIVAFFYILRLMTQNRDLFPRKYFVTMGAEGIAMHFSRFHYPLIDPRAFIPWNEVRSLKRTACGFFPAIFIGNFSPPAVEVSSSTGKQIVIPLNLPENELGPSLDKIEIFIRNRINK